MDAARKPLLPVYTGLRARIARKNRASAKGMAHPHDKFGASLRLHLQERKFAIASQMTRKPHEHFA